MNIFVDIKRRRIKVARIMKGVKTRKDIVLKFNLTDLRSTIISRDSFSKESW